MSRALSRAEVVELCDRLGFPANDVLRIELEPDAVEVTVRVPINDHARGAHVPGNLDRLDVFTSGDRFVVLDDQGAAVEYHVMRDGALADYRLGATSEPEPGGQA